jgi:hypothetical protein
MGRKSATASEQAAISEAIAEKPVARHGRDYELDLSAVVAN